METKKLRALIVVNGLIKNPRLIMDLLSNYYHFSNRYLIICTDGAVKNCLKLKLFPEIVIGDMDSINEKDMEILKSCGNNVTYIKSHIRKDESDAQLALEYAVDNKINNILLAGALGKRTDHSLANIFNIASDKFKNMDIKIIDDNYEISILRKSAEIEGTVGNILSMFSLTPVTYFVSTDGLEYKLENEELLFSPVRGLSNIFRKKTARINIKDGILLLVKEIKHI